MAVIEISVPQVEFDTHVENSTILVRNQAAPTMPEDDIAAAAAFGPHNPLGTELARRFWTQVLHGMVAGVRCSAEVVQMDGQPYIRMQVEYEDA